MRAWSYLPLVPEKRWREFGGEERCRAHRSRPGAATRHTEDGDALIRAILSRHDYDDVDWSSLANMLPGRSARWIQYPSAVEAPPQSHHRPLVIREEGHECAFSLRFLHLCHFSRLPGERSCSKGSCFNRPALSFLAAGGRENLGQNCWQQRLNRRLCMIWWRRHGR